VNAKVARIQPDESDRSADSSASSIESTDTIVIGTIVGFHSDGNAPLVVFRGQQGTGGIVARATIDLHGAHVGLQVVLAFESNDRRRPIVMGALQDESVKRVRDTKNVIEVDVDGERLVVKAREQLVLQCGKSSITLTRAGKILIQGAYVANRSSGVMRISGGTVQIN
jgi:hypothetical protein